MGSYSDYRKKKKEEVLGASSEKISGGTYGEYAARKRIGFDTLESDLNTLGSTISNVYSGWQDADTMANTRTSVEDMQKRLGSYQEYQKKYGGADLSDIASGYQSVLDDWDNLSSVYGYYQNADAYNSAVKKSKMDKDFGGLSYDDVQSKLKEYKEGSDEHKYLSEYMGYSDLRDFDKALSNAANGDYKEKLQAERNKYALDNTFDLYKDRMNAENFEETSQYVSTKADGFWDKFTSQYGLGYKDLAYEYINDQNGMRSEIKNQARIYGRDSGDGISSYEKKGYDKLNEDEIAVYNSLYAEDPEEAQKFLDAMEITLTKRVYDENTQRWEEIADSGVVGSTLASALSVPANLLGAFTGTMENIKDSISGKPYNPYGYYKTPSNFSSDTRQYVSENIEEATEGMNAPIIGNVGSFLYNTGMSMADSTFGAMTMGKAFTPLLGLSASQQKAKELTEAGASEEEVFWTSLASGVAEAAMEYTAIDNLFKVKNTDSAAKIFTNAMKQAGAEGLEEVGTEVINTIADTWIRGDSSELAQMYEELLTRGFTEKEAKTEIAKEFGTRVGQAFLGGAFSGGVMGGVYSGNQKAELGALGQTIRENHAVTDLQDIASGLNNDAYADYLKLIEGNKISNAKLGNLYTEVENEVSENYEKEKSNAQMRPMADRAIELGDTKNSGMIASAVTKHLNGEKLSAEEKAMLKTETAQTILVDAKRGDIQVKATDSLNKAMDNATKMRNIVEMPIDEKARRARVAELNVGEVTEVTSTGNSTKIDGIRVEDGSTIVLTSEGEVKAEDMTFSAKDAEMLSYAENMSPDKANLFLSQYDGKVDVEDYRNSFNMAYSYGEVGFAADTVLKNKGVLTEVQASEIYKQSLKMASDRKQKVIDEINEKQKGNTFVKGTFDDSIINYKGNTTDKNNVSWSKLTPQQRSAIIFAKGFSKATGVNIKFINSNVVNGEHKGKNGSYNPSTNTIEIDVYAGRIDAKSITDSIVPTLSHEVTHWMKAKSPAMYNKMKEHIAETLAMNDGKTIEQRVDDEMVRMKSAHSKMNVTPEMAIDEIIARSCEDMLSNSEKARELLNGLTKAEQNDLVSKIKDAFKNLIKWVNDLLNTYKSNSEEAKILREYESRLKELSKMWDEALVNAIEANQSLQHEGVKGEEAINKALEEIGLHFDAESETVYSYRSLEDAFHMDDAEDFLRTKEEYIDALMKATKRDRKVCENYLNSLFLVHDMIGNDRARLDYEAAVNKSSWVSNSEYGGSIDFSTLCAKRRLFTGTMDAIIEQLPNTVLTDTDFLDIRSRLLAKELEAPCSMCYVEGSRAKNSIYINNWLKEYKKTNPEWIPQLADFTSTTRLEKTRLQHPEAYKAYQDAMNKLAQRKPKEASVRTDYKGEIKVAFADGTSVDIKNKNGGIRFNSFSDFEIIHALDCMQVITDMATVGLAGQGYTKVKEFAECFGNTGMKINLSLVAKGVDADGKLIFDEVNGMKYKDAIDLRNRFSKNVGTVIVVFNHNQLKAALRDDSIDYVLPFHRSQWRKAQYVLMGLPTEVTDYTMHQNDRITNPKTKKPVKLAKLKHIATYTNDITGETYEIKDNIMPNQYWDYNADGVTNARRYLDYINSNKMTPKFAFLLIKDVDGNWVLPTDKDGNVTAEGKGYFKTLIDFKMYDNDGVGSPQTPVVPDFNMPYINNMLDSYMGGHEAFPVAHDVADGFVKDYKKNHPKEQYSDRDSEVNTNPTEDADISYSDRKMTRSEANKLAREKVATYKEQIEKKAKIESITQKALVLNRWMLKNSKDEHIPEAMKPVVSHLLQAIDFSSKQYLGMRGGKHKGMPTKTDLSIAQALADVQKMMSEAKVDGEILYELYGADLDKDMAKLVESVNLYARTVGDNEYVLNQMTLDELHYLDKIVGAIKTSVSQMNRFHVANSKKGIAATAQMDMLSMKSLGQIELPKTKLGKGVSELLNWGNINPYFAFKRFGEGGKAIFTALQDGWDKFAFNVKKIIEYAKETYTNDEVKEWSEEVHEIDVLLPATKDQLADPNFKGNRKRIQMTTAQIMSLYCLQKRDQAKGHISGGGIRITDIETKKGIISQSEGVTITEKELDKIIGKLTSRQKEVADALQKFMNEDCTVWGNEISMARFGYKAFGEKNYFPIKSDENVTNDGEVKEKEKTLYRLLNMSFTKALTDKANNRIVVDNIFDVFAQHTSEMAKYNAMALPVLDAVRWFNYKEKGKKVDTHFDTHSIKQAMEKAYGKDAKKYVNTFLEDLNGADNVGRDSLAKGFFSNAKIASVAFNLKVAALQPTSYLRASVVIDPKYLTKAMNPKNVKDGIDKAKKYCGMAYWKSLGFYDTNIQRGVTELIKHDKSTKDKITEASMKGAEKMDEMTWGFLWNACEMMMKDTRQDLEPGTDEFYKEVGKKLREVIYATQVVDSTMTRSQMMRSPDRWDKVLTNFASEPTLSYNMLMDVFFDWQMEARRTNKSNAFSKYKGKMARVAVAYTATNLVTALLETAFMAYRDDDEEEEDFEEYVIAFLENFGSNMGISTKIPYVKDLISVLQGFSSDRMDTQWIQKFVYACKDWLKIFNGEGNVYKAVYRTLDTASQVSGLPMSNATRELVSAINLVISVWNATIASEYTSLKKVYK